MSLAVLFFAAAAPVIELAPPPAEPPPAVEQPADPAPEAASRMDRLFQSLREAEQPEDAAFVAEEIDALWRVGGGATAELLVERAETAVTTDDLDLARRLVNGALELDPSYMRAWSISAMTAYADNDLARALEHIQKAVELEPRHWESFLGLGLILERLERWQGAYDAYSACLDIYPHHEDAQARRAALEPRVRGRDL